MLCQVTEVERPRGFTLDELEHAVDGARAQRALAVVEVFGQRPALREDESADK